jgi:hypothetical protein
MTTQRLRVHDVADAVDAALTELRAEIQLNRDSGSISTSGCENSGHIATGNQSMSNRLGSSAITVENDRRPASLGCLGIVHGTRSYPTVSRNGTFNAGRTR